MALRMFLLCWWHDINFKLVVMVHYQYCVETKNLFLSLLVLQNKVRINWYNFLTPEVPNLSMDKLTLNLDGKLCEFFTVSLANHCSTAK